MTFEQSLAAGGLWALPIAFLGGVAAGLNPCCLPIYPAVAATCCANASRPMSLALSRAIALIAGTVVATTALGVAAAFAGHAVAGIGRGWRYGLAFAPMIAGLYVLGGYRRARAEPQRTRIAGGILGAFGLGLLLSVMIGTCGTPILAAVLSYAAFHGTSLFGAGLLFSYGLGASLPLLALALGLHSALAHPALLKARPWMDRAAGVGLVGASFYLLLKA